MKKKIIISVAAILLITVILSLCTMLVSPKYATNLDGRLTSEYYTAEKGNDIIFLGDCEVYETFVPAILWEEYGITSYVRGNAQQLVWQSYYILEETFKYEKPKAVVFNVYALKYGEDHKQNGAKREEYNRLMLDKMRWSTSKIGAINASMTDEESFFDYLFPLLRYHSRITELEGDDVKYMFTEPAPALDSGYLMRAGVDPRPNIEKGKEVYNTDFSEYTLGYLDKIRELCAKNDCELILVKAPTNTWEYFWHEDYEAQVKQYAYDHGLAYYNLIEHETDIGLDWNEDTYDKGFHLNVHGAEKTTVYFGKLLTQLHGFTENRDVAREKVWTKNLTKYYARKKALLENDGNTEITE